MKGRIASKPTKCDSGKKGYSDSASLTLHLRPISHENDKLQQNDSTIYRMLIKCFCMSQMLNSCYSKLHSWLLAIKFPYKYKQIEKANKKQKTEKNSE